MEKTREEILKERHGDGKKEIDPKFFPLTPEECFTPDQVKFYTGKLNWEEARTVRSWQVRWLQSKAWDATPHEIREATMLAIKERGINNLLFE